MAPLLLPPGTPIEPRLGATPELRLQDCWEACFPGTPGPIEGRLRAVVMGTPLRGLHAAVDAAEVTRGQWLLFTATLFVGQTLNGGVSQFVGNFPGLVRDAALMLDELGPPTLRDAYVAYAAPLLAVIAAHSNAAEHDRSDLDEVWADWEEADDALDEALAAVIDRHADYRRHEDPDNWLSALETRAVEMVLAHPGDFREPG